MAFQDSGSSNYLLFMVNFELKKNWIKMRLTASFVTESILLIVV